MTNNYIVRRFRITEAQDDYLKKQYKGYSVNMVIRKLISEDFERKRKENKLNETHCHNS